MTRTPERLVRQAAADLIDTLPHLAAALANLASTQPGFPATTPGNGNPGAGGGSGGGSSITERLAERGLGGDDAYRDQQALGHHLQACAEHARWIHDLAKRWGYTVAGEWHPGSRPRPHAADGEAPSNRAKWCDNCRRYGIHNPARGPQTPICRWCADWQQSFGVLPPEQFVRMHDEGRRITSAVIEPWRRTLPKSKKGKKR